MTEYTYTGQFSYTGSFGLMYYNARWYDPSLGRFAQADTIVPPGVQGLDRYAYVNNSPINYVDPSGHFTCSNDKNSDDYCPGKPPSFTVISRSSGKGNGGDEAESNSIIEGTVGIISDVKTKIYDDWVTLEGACGNTGYSDVINNSACLDYYSVISQDLATISSGVGASTTAITTTLGCVAGSEAGVLPGCAAGYAAGYWFHVNVTNHVESGLNIVSYFATMRSDYLTGDTKIPGIYDAEFRILLGEDTITASHTFVAGVSTTEPFVDFAIDIYSSGYNHGYFCGMSTILDCFGP